MDSIESCGKDVMDEAKLVDDVITDESKLASCLGRCLLYFMTVDCGIDIGKEVCSVLR